MANEIKLTLKVDDNGSLNIVGKEAKSAASNVDNLDKSQKKLNKTQQASYRTQQGAAHTSSNLTKNFAKQAQGIGGGLVPAYAVLAANVFAVTAAFGALQRAAQVTQLEEGLRAIGAASGIAMTTLSRDLQAATGHALSLEEAMRSTALVISAGFDTSTLEELGTVARQASLALGRDTADSLARLTRGATKLEPELLDELGIMVRLDEATENYAAKIGKTASELTNFEKRQAFMNAVLEEGNKKFAALGNVDTNPYNRLSAAFQDLSKSLLGGLAGAITPVIEFLSTSVVGLAATLALFGIGVIKNMIPALGEMAASSETAALASSELSQNKLKEIEVLDGTTQATKDYQNALKSGTATQEDLAKLEKRAFKGTKRSIDINTKALEEHSRTRGLSSTAVENHTKRLKQSKLVLNELTARRYADTTALEFNTRAVVLNEISHGNLGKGLKDAMAALKGQTVSLKGAMAASFGMGKATIFLTGALNIAGAAATFAGAAFARIFPLLAVAGILFAAGSAAFSFFKDKFTTEKEKLYEQQMKALTETQKELKEAQNNLNDAFEGNSPILTTVTQKYAALSNSIDQYQNKLKKAIAVADPKDTKELEASLNTQIKGNKFLTQAFEEQYGAGATLNSVLKGTDDRLGKLNEINDKVLTGTKISSDRFVSFSKAVENANKSTTDLFNTLKVKTPFDQVIADIQDMTNSFEAMGLEMQKQFATEGNDALLTLFDLREEAKSVRQGEKLVKEAQEKIKKIDADYEKERQKTLTNAGGRFGIGAKNIAANQAAARAALKAQRDIEAAEQEKIIKDQEALEQGLVAITGERIKGTLELLKTKQEEFIVAKATAQAGAINLKTLKSSQANTVARLQEEFAIRERILDAQVKEQEATIFLAEMAGKSLAARIEEAEANLESASTTEERAKFAAILNSLQQQYNIQTSKGIVAEAKRNSLLQQRSDIDKGGVETAKRELEVLQFKQKAEKAILDIRQKALKITKEEIDLTRRQAESRLKAENARNKLIGAALSASDKTSIELDIRDDVIKSIKEEGAIKSKQIDLEYDLIGAKYKLLRAEIQAHNLTAGAGDQIDTTFLDTAIGNLGVLRQKALDLVQDQTDQEITELKERVNTEVFLAQLSKETQQERLQMLQIEKSIQEQREKITKELEKQQKVTIDIARLENRTAAGTVKSKAQEIAIDHRRKSLEVEIARTRLQNLIRVQEIESTILEAKLNLRIAEFKLANKTNQLNEQQKAVIDAERALLELKRDVMAETRETALLEIKAAEKRSQQPSKTGGLGSTFSEIQRFESASAKATQAILTEAAGKRIEIGRKAAVEEARIQEQITAKQAEQDAAGGLGTAEGKRIQGEIQALNTKRLAIEQNAQANKAAAIQSMADMNTVRGLFGAFAEDFRALGPEGEAIAAIIDGANAMTSAYLVFFDSMANGATGLEKTAAAFGMLGSMVGALAQMMKGQSDARIKMIDKELAAEQKRDGSSAASVAKMTALEKKKEAVERKSFEQQKKLQMAQIVLNTASAAMMSVAMLGPVAGGILAGVMVALGAKMLSIAQSATYDGGGATTVPKPTTISVGQRQNRVDLARNNAGGELSYMRGESGTGTSASNFTPTPAFAGARYRAAGGATAGYVVGEQGPELFVPQTPGEIVPNDDLPAGAPINVNFNVQAIDATSFNDALVTQRGNIIGMIREAANNTGEMFLEGVDTTAMQMER